MGFNLTLQSFHFACFTCRKSFKKSVQYKVDFTTGYRSHEKMEFICPNCKQKMEFMGLHFAAPRHNQPHRWRQLTQGRQRMILRSYQATLDREARQRRGRKRRATENARIDRERAKQLREMAEREKAEAAGVRE